MVNFKRYFIHDESTALNWEYINSIPEFRTLNICRQNPKWHGEGDAMAHTKKCLEYAYQQLKTEPYASMDIGEKRLLIMAVLFHDIGKGITTEYKKGAWHAYGHEIAGERIARNILWDEDISLREEICFIIRYHMDILKVLESKNPLEKIAQISYSGGKISHLIFVKLCDIFGSEPEDSSVTYNDAEIIRIIGAMADQIGCCDNSWRVMKLFPDDTIYTPRRIIFGKSIKKPKITAIMLIGLPGSGKNTWITDFLSKQGENAEKWAVLSRDDIRVEMNFCEDGDKVVCSHDKEEMVSKIYNARMIEAIENGKNIILNNINLKKPYRDNFKTLLKGYDIEWKYIYVEAPTLSDNVLRRPMIEERIFHDMILKFDWPRSEEYDSFEISKNTKCS